MDCRILLLPVLFILMVSGANGQEMPPRPVSVSFIRDLNFGAFSQSSSGGSVMIYPSGSRTSTGDIVLVNLGYLYYPAIFQLEGNPGTIVHLLAGSTASLSGNQGGTLSMTYGTSDPVTPFILPFTGQGPLNIYIGGILTVGSPSFNPPGDYSGSFYLMFIQE